MNDRIPRDETPKHEIIQDFIEENRLLNVTVEEMQDAGIRIERDRDWTSGDTMYMHFEGTNTTLSISGGYIATDRKSTIRETKETIDKNPKMKTVADKIFSQLESRDYYLEDGYGYELPFRLLIGRASKRNPKKMSRANDEATIKTFDFHK